MNRKTLEDMGLTKEQIDVIMSANGSDIENAKSTLQKEIDGLNEQIKDRDKQLTDLKKTAGDNETLTKQISDLQAANKQAREAHESELTQLKIDFAVDKALTGANAKNNKAVRALLDLTGAELDKDGSVKGLQAQIDALAAAEDTKFLFDVKEPPKFQGFKPGTSGNVKPAVSGADTSKMTYSEMIAYKAEHPEAVDY